MKIYIVSVMRYYIIIRYNDHQKIIGTFTIAHAKVKER
jgi:hypothetical protein